MTNCRPSRRIGVTVAPGAVFLILIVGPPTGDAVVHAQTTSVVPDVNAAFQDPDVDQFVERFEREGREVYDLRRDIVAACGIEPGMAVADIGAGTGLFTRLFAEAVGTDGRVYAVDISEGFVEHVQASCREAGWTNVTGVVCPPDDTGLPPRSIDVAFICDTYHHFEYPRKTMLSLRRALRPGGRVFLIDFSRGSESSDWIRGHVRAGEPVVRSELLQSGFTVTRELDLMRENYFLKLEPARDILSASHGEARLENGVWVTTIDSPYQSQSVQVRVLLPESATEEAPVPAVYVLPVEAGKESRWGDPLAEIRSSRLHETHGVACIFPTFAQLPWYADHPGDPGIRQESHLLEVVVPYVESQYPVVPRREGRRLIGFSKSGWGAWSLLLRHPDVFERAVAWDVPWTLAAPDRFGCGPIFGDLENFNRYEITKLLEESAGDFDDSGRLVLLGAASFTDARPVLERQLVEQGVPFTDRPEVTADEHHWSSGWLPAAMEVAARGNVPTIRSPRP